MTLLLEPLRFQVTDVLNTLDEARGIKAAGSPETVLAETRAFLDDMATALRGRTSGTAGATSRGGSEA